VAGPPAARPRLLEAPRARTRPAPRSRRPVAGLGERTGVAAASGKGGCAGVAAHGRGTRGPAPAPCLRTPPIGPRRPRRAGPVSRVRRCDRHHEPVLQNRRSRAPIGLGYWYFICPNAKNVSDVPRRLQELSVTYRCGLLRHAGPQGARARPAHSGRSRCAGAPRRSRSAGPHRSYVPPTGAAREAGLPELAVALRQPVGRSLPAGARIDREPSVSQPQSRPVRRWLRRRSRLIRLCSVGRNGFRLFSVPSDVARVRIPSPAPAFQTRKLCELRRHGPCPSGLGAPFSGRAQDIGSAIAKAAAAPWPGSRSCRA
jgi:hypothetical protein